mmetsp:Transcript_106669/g.206678  ORF Transcript_106669/g.206678 Transcript_106669/m.206678 type:complete len:85 (-) Transcript_106669:329-583(-)
MRVPALRLGDQHLRNVFHFFNVIYCVQDLCLTLGMRTHRLAGPQSTFLGVQVAEATGRALLATPRKIEVVALLTPSTGVQPRAY